MKPMPVDRNPGSMEMGHLGRLPEDVLVDVLRRLAARGLAVTRCVCKACRAVIDDHRLLRVSFSQEVEGIFVMFSDPTDEGNLKLFCPRSTATARRVSCQFRYLDDVSSPYRYRWSPEDHCNGLLLLWEGIVLNPATRQWVRLPPLPQPPGCSSRCYCSIDYKFLAFDPTASPHFEVVSVPDLPRELRPGHISHHVYLHEDDDSVDAAMMLQSEWPPSLFILDVFSSRAGQWKQRSFVREGMPAGTVADVKMDQHGPHRHAAYWHGALYVHCQNDFLIRLNLSSDKYQVIHFPEIKPEHNESARLGKSKNGVHCALIHRKCIFEFWFLDESCGQMKWVLKHHINLNIVPPNFGESYGTGPWILIDDDNFNDFE